MTDKADFDLRHLILIEKLFNASWELEEVKDHAVKLVCSMLDAESASILLHDPKRKGFFFEVAVGPKGKEIHQKFIPLTEKSIARKVFEEEKTHILREFDPKSREHHMDSFDNTFKYQTRNMICTTIRSNNELLGVLQVINKIDQEFNGRDKQLCELLSMLIGQAVKISLLMNKPKRTCYSREDGNPG